MDKNTCLFSIVPPEFNSQHSSGNLWQFVLCESDPLLWPTWGTELKVTQTNIQAKDTHIHSQSLWNKIHFFFGFLRWGFSCDSTGSSGTCFEEQSGLEINSNMPAFAFWMLVFKVYATIKHQNYKNKNFMLL